MSFLAYSVPRRMPAGYVVPGDQIVIRAGRTPIDALHRYDSLMAMGELLTWHSVLSIEPANMPPTLPYARVQLVMDPGTWTLAVDAESTLVVRVGVEIDAYADGWEAVPPLPDTRPFSPPPVPLGAKYHRTNRPGHAPEDRP